MRGRMNFRVEGLTGACFAIFLCVLLYSSCVCFFAMVCGTCRIPDENELERFLD